MKLESFELLGARQRIILYMMKEGVCVKMRWESAR